MRALIAMSGGVDSAVAARLAQEAALECVGCTMKLYGNEDIGLSRGHTCCSLDDVEDARSVAYGLGMDHFVFNFSEDFREKIIDKFISSYERGLTPNPCIDCNRYMKFDKLYDRADILDCRYIVTGHYARIERRGGRYILKKAKYPEKDQSYVLYSMTQEQLSRTVFPLGELSKAEVRAMAEKWGFQNARKPDSQDICFVPDGDYPAAIRRLGGKEYPEGDFIDAEGNVMGRHKGIIAYTVGQRRGLGIAAERPLYVKAIDAGRNAVTLAFDEELYGREAYISDVNRIFGDSGHVRCRVKIRYRHPEQPAEVTFLPDGRARVLFDEPQRAITPGQAAVFYDGDDVIGGGVIDHTENTQTE